MEKVESIEGAIRRSLCIQLAVFGWGAETSATPVLRHYPSHYHAAFVLFEKKLEKGKI